MDGSGWSKLTELMAEAGQVVLAGVVAPGTTSSDGQSRWPKVAEERLRPEGSVVASSKDA